MKTPDEIRKRLDEYREERLDLDKNYIKELVFPDVMFERIATIEGSIEALKWVLKEINDEI